MKREGRHVNIEDLPERERKRAEAERKAKIEEEVSLAPIAGISCAQNLTSKSGSRWKR
jgi:hypothetical protein